MSDKDRTDHKARSGGGHRQESPATFQGQPGRGRKQDSSRQSSQGRSSLPQQEHSSRQSQSAELSQGGHGKRQTSQPHQGVSQSGQASQQSRHQRQPRQQQQSGQQHAQSHHSYSQEPQQQQQQSGSHQSGQSGRNRKHHGQRQNPAASRTDESTSRPQGTDQHGQQSSGKQTSHPGMHQGKTSVSPHVGSEQGSWHDSSKSASGGKMRNSDKISTGGVAMAKGRMVASQVDTSSDHSLSKTPQNGGPLASHTPASGGAVHALSSSHLPSGNESHSIHTGLSGLASDALLRRTAVPAMGNAVSLNGSSLKAADRQNNATMAEPIDSAIIGAAKQDSGTSWGPASQLYGMLSENSLHNSLPQFGNPVLGPLSSSPSRQQRGDQLHSSIEQAMRSQHQQLPSSMSLSRESMSNGGRQPIPSGGSSVHTNSDNPMLFPPPTSPLKAKSSVGQPSLHSSDNLQDIRPPLTSEQVFPVAGSSPAMLAHSPAMVSSLESSLRSAARSVPSVPPGLPAPPSRPSGMDPNVPPFQTRHAVNLPLMTGPSRLGPDMHARSTHTELPPQAGLPSNPVTLPPPAGLPSNQVTLPPPAGLPSNPATLPPTAILPSNPVPVTGLASNPATVANLTSNPVTVPPAGLPSKPVPPPAGLVPVPGLLPLQSQNQGKAEEAPKGSVPAIQPLQQAMLFLQDDVSMRFNDLQQKQLQREQQMRQQSRPTFPPSPVHQPQLRDNNPPAPDQQAVPPTRGSNVEQAAHHLPDEVRSFPEQRESLPAQSTTHAPARSTVPPGDHPFLPATSFGPPQLENPPTNNVPPSKMNPSRSVGSENDTRPVEVSNTSGAEGPTSLGAGPPPGGVRPPFPLPLVRPGHFYPPYGMGLGPMYNGTLPPPPPEAYYSGMLPPPWMFSYPPGSMMSARPPRMPDTVRGSTREEDSEVRNLDDEVDHGTLVAGRRTPNDLITANTTSISQPPPENSQGSRGNMSHADSVSSVEGHGRPEHNGHAGAPSGITEQPQSMEGRWSEHQSPLLTPSQEHALPTMDRSPSTELTVALEVGGRVFQVLPSTFTKFPGSLLNDVFNGRHANCNQRGNIAFDRDGCLFEYLLAYCRTGKIFIHPQTNMGALYEEAEFFGLEKYMFAPGMELNSRHAVAYRRATEHVLTAGSEDDHRVVFVLNKGDSLTIRKIEASAPCSLNVDMFNLDGYLQTSNWTVYSPTEPNNFAQYRFCGGYRLEFHLECIDCASAGMRVIFHQLFSFAACDQVFDPLPTG